MATNNRLPRKDSSHCILMQNHSISMPFTQNRSSDIYVLFS